MTKMLIDRATVEQALEALKSDPNAVVEVSEGRWKLKSDLAIAALRAALAEPEQEPVALPSEDKARQAFWGCYPDTGDGDKSEVWMTAFRWCRAMLSPQAARDESVAQPVQEPDSPERRCGGPGCDMTCCQPGQEPVAWLTPGQDLHLNNGEGFRFSDWTPLYTAPPQRLPLTEDAMQKVFTDSFGLCPEPGGFLFRVGRAVERAHKIGGEE